MAAENELAVKLQKQIVRNESDAENVQPVMRVFNPYTDFKEFSRKEIQSLEKTFKSYDVNNDKKLDVEELKAMMEKLKVPQTHLGLKEMIRQVDEDHDNKISFKEFLSLFLKAKNGEFKNKSLESAQEGLKQLYDQLMEINVSETGVLAAKSFFEAQALRQSLSSNFEREIQAEQNAKRHAEEEKRKKREDFLSKMSMFNK